MLIFIEKLFGCILKKYIEDVLNKRLLRRDKCIIVYKRSTLSIRVRIQSGQYCDDLSFNLQFGKPANQFDLFLFNLRIFFSWGEYNISNHIANCYTKFAQNIFMFYYMFIYKIKLNKILNGKTNFVMPIDYKSINQSNCYSSRTRMINDCQKLNF